MKRPFSELLSDYLNGTLPAAELEEFFSLVPANRDLLADAIDGKAAMDQPLPENKDRTERMLLQLEAVLDKMDEPASERAEVPRIPFLRRWGWVAAASVLMLAAAAYFLIASNKKNQSSAALAAKTADIVPGHKGAILTLSNGTQVLLDSLDNGIIAHQTGAKVLLQNGRLAYDPTGEKTAEMVYNTMTTPRGRQFQLTLPDGTKVWLNAASSIRYPTAFSDTERKVEITGEAYFEVAKNSKMPFRVNVNNRAEIEVLGTNFNVNAYENETTLNTTLLQGSIRVLAGNQLAGRQSPESQLPKSQFPGNQFPGNQEQQQAGQKTGPGKEKEVVVLKPGQQAQIRNAITVVDNKDLDKIMAWKNGAFDFEDLPLEEAMRQLERWYDIKVVYKNGLPDVRFGGKIGRDVRLEDLLQMLAGTKLKFRMEKGRELLILK